MEAPGMTFETICRRLEERRTRSMAGYAARRSGRASACPLAALGRWVAGCRRPAPILDPALPR